MSDATLQEKVIQGLQDGDIDLADPGVTVETITIDQYEVVRQRGLDLLRETDFSLFADGISADTFPPGTPQCDIDEASATLMAYAREEFFPQTNLTATVLALVSDFPGDAVLVDALAQVGDVPYQPYLGPGSITAPETPDEPDGPLTPDTPIEPVPETGTAEDDVLRGSNDADILRGKGGDDTLIGRSGDDKLIGGGGADKVKGGRGDDTVKGGGGSDDLKGNGGVDNIKGGGGDDTIKGGGGGDVMTGGGGNDLLIGGGGDDMFVFSGRSGSDRISGFAFGSDKLDIRQVDDFASLTIEQVGGSARIDFDGGQILLVGRLASNLGEDDFMF